ncbi:murein biosynthesis integral membrane protein MurJ [Bacillus sp. 7894-2]|uniref:murein biosynthesis integral membrane protein MurJ n=1 Tax=Bacillus sp. 7894-2 TaxID=2021695 RepID=UPI000BA68B9F|nr:murein biosynthesis integral membrane protein MurJ [Bacillus sp. 7894-2]PAE25821.1 murein biosynthesis integral membrane protein MurJ [Bacillus sp. 7894-2]
MKRKLLQAAGALTLIAIMSKLLGFGRELLMASYFGASITTDAYFVASIIPVLMFTAVGMAITTGMVPLYAEAKAKSQQEASDIISVMGTLFLILSIILTGLLYLLTPLVTRLMAPGFTDSQLELTNILTWIMLPSFCFYVLSAIMTGILEYEKVFTPPAFGAIPQNILIIAAIVFLNEWYGIYGIAVATLLGAFSQFLIQYPFIRKYKVLRLNFQFKKHSKVIKSTIIGFAPIVVASLAYQLNAVVDRMIASGLSEGSVSALNYSNKLMFLPLSIVLLSLITVIFPSIVDAAIEKGDRLVRLIFNGMSAIGLIGIPIVIVMLVESQNLVNIAYKRGAFDEEAAIMTASAFFFYSFGMIFIALKEFLNRAFVAMKATKVTMIGSVGSVAANIVLSILFAKFFGVGGIALATSIAMILQTIFLFMYLPKKTVIKKGEIPAFFVSGLKLLAIFITGYFIVDFIYPLYNQMEAFVSFMVSTAIAFFIAGAGAVVLKCREITWVMDLIRRKRSQKHGEK